MRYVIRPVQPAEWQKSKQFRLRALQDPVSTVAFARSYAEESVFGDEVWQERASGHQRQQFAAVSASGSAAGATQVDADAEWAGSLVVIAERPDYLSINGVYLLPEARGTGLAEKLFAAAIAWTWDRADRVYLWVHQDNGRAEAFYQRFGFTRTGETMAHPLDASQTEYEMVLIRG